MRWSTLRRGRSSPAIIMSSIRASLVSSTRRRRRSSSVDVALVHASSVVRQTLMRGFVQLSDLPVCVALAVFLSTCLPQPAAAQDYVWSAITSQGNASLLYGPPGADSSSFTLLCYNSAKKTELELYAAL